MRNVLINHLRTGELRRLVTARCEIDRVCKFDFRKMCSRGKAHRQQTTRKNRCLRSAGSYDFMHKKESLSRQTRACSCTKKPGVRPESGTMKLLFWAARLSNHDAKFARTQLSF